jgi:hypothetical protein
MSVMRWMIPTVILSSYLRDIYICVLSFFATLPLCHLGGNLPPGVRVQLSLTYSVSYFFPGFPQDPRLKIQVPFFTLNILSSEPLLKVKMPSPTNPYADAHLSPNGADDGRLTALQVIHDEGLVNKLVGKVMLVTGASSGIGIDTVAALHATGADRERHY